MDGKVDIPEMQGQLYNVWLSGGHDKNSEDQKSEGKLNYAFGL